MTVERRLGTGPGRETRGALSRQHAQTADGAVAALTGESQEGRVGDARG